MGSFHLSCLIILFYTVLGLCSLHQSLTNGADTNQTAKLLVNAVAGSGHKASETLFGLFFEEINHAGTGGIWSELVSNRGFEAGGHNIPSNIDPWSVIGDDSSIILSIDKSSLFSNNKIALKMEVLCDATGCPTGGVGTYNPGFWGMNIEQGKTYKVTLHVKSVNTVNITVSSASSDGAQILAASNIIATASEVSNWKKVEVTLTAQATNHYSRLQLTTTIKGVIWLDQVSAMPTNTYKGHGFRKELIEMLEDLKPRFLRFPGGCFVEGEWLRNAFRWKETVGPWEERPGHFGDVWMYWTDDGLGYFEFLQLSEDLGALPVWVFNNGISHQDEVATSSVTPFVQEALDGLEFARGGANSTWGSLRAAMGHPESFYLRYVAVGNEDCGKKYYRGNYLRFYDAIKKTYPDIQIISNCDGSSRQLDHPADLYDFHIYTNANNLFNMAHQFDRTSRAGPMAFVSEYAVTGTDAAHGSFLASLAEAAFLIGLERNSDIIGIASYAPLFVNINDRRWNPDAIVFDSWQQYGTPSFWVQKFFAESSGATVLNTNLTTTSSASLIASAISWQNADDKNNYLRIKIVNFDSSPVSVKISVDGLSSNSIDSVGSTKTTLTSSNLMEENSFQTPNKIVPTESLFDGAGTDMDVVLAPHSLTSFNLLRNLRSSHITDVVDLVEDISIV